MPKITSNNTNDSTPELEIVLSTKTPHQTSSDDTADSAANGDAQSQNNSFSKSTIQKTIVTPLANVKNIVSSNTVGYIVPKIEKIPWYHFIFLSIIVAMP